MDSVALGVDARYEVFEGQARGAEVRGAEGALLRSRDGGAVLWRGHRGTRRLLFYLSVKFVKLLLL